MTSSTVSGKQFALVFLKETEQKRTNGIANVAILLLFMARVTPIWYPILRELTPNFGRLIRRHQLRVNHLTKSTYTQKMLFKSTICLSTLSEDSNRSWMCEIRKSTHTSNTTPSLSIHWQSTCKTLQNMRETNFRLFFLINFLSFLMAGSQKTYTIWAFLHPFRTVINHLGFVLST